MVTAGVQAADSSTVTTLGDTQALPRVTDVDPGEPAGVPVPVQLPTARPAPVTAAPPTEALELRPFVGPVPGAPETEGSALPADPADETPDGPGDTAEQIAEDGDEAQPAGPADSPSPGVPHEQIYEEAMASIAALAQDWSEAVDDLHGRGTDRSAA